MYQAPFNKRQDLRLAQRPRSKALKSRRNHTLKWKYVSLLCCVCPLPRIRLRAPAKSLEKCSWKLLLIYGTVFAPWKQHKLEYLSYELSLINIHDSYHFMSLLLFTLNGFVWNSPTCACVKWSACMHNYFFCKFHICLYVYLKTFFNKNTYTCALVHIYPSICLYMCTWGHNFSLDSFIKCSAAAEAAVNQFYLQCVGGQLLWHLWTMTPQEWDRLCSAIAAVLMLPGREGVVCLLSIWFTWGEGPGRFAAQLSMGLFC